MHVDVSWSSRVFHMNMLNMWAMFARDAVPSCRHVHVHVHVDVHVLCMHMYMPVSGHSVHVYRRRWYRELGREAGVQKPDRLRRVR